MSNEIEQAALLMMDVQPGILDRVPDKDGYLRQVGATVDAAHEKGIPVIYVVVGLRPGMPEVSQRNKWFNTIGKVFPRQATVLTSEEWARGS